MYCSSCGAKDVADSNFCRQCGRKLEKLSIPTISEEAFDRALPDEQQVTALLERAYQRRKENNIPGAIMLCQDVLALRPDSTTAHGLLGQLYEQIGERDNAVDQYEQVLKLNPGSIADRVKLDDLREGRAAPSPGRSPLPKIVVVDPNGAPLRNTMLWGVGFCVLLILSGAAIAVAFNRHDGIPPPDREYSAATSASKNARMIGDSNRENPTDGKSSASNRTGPDPRSMSSQGAAVQTYMPAYSFPPAVQYTAPPVQYIIPQGYVPRQAASMPSGPSGPIVRPQRTIPAPERQPSDADNGGDRVHLAVSDVASDGHNVVINVAKRDEHSGSARSNPDQGPGVAGTINVSTHKGPVDTSSATAPSSDSTAMIAVGQEKLNKMDYAGAIIAFTKALAGANDESAYIYTEMGHCYQARNESRNALAMYTRGRDEYRKLIAAGRQVERANAGIRICETGIKICSQE